MRKYQAFIEECSVKVRQNVKLSRYCTFKIGGPADLLVNIENIEDLLMVIRLANKLKIQHLIIAGGSNLLFDDAGFRGLVIHFVANNIEIDEKTRVVDVEAGCSLNYLVKYMAKHNLGGINFLANIPGSVGGAIVGNAGCYGNPYYNLEKSLFS